MSSSPVETEIKLSIPDAEAGRQLLQKHGFEVRTERSFEANAIYDTAGGDVRRSGALLRLRQTDSRSVLTYKGVSTPGRHKSRSESEVTVSDFQTMHQILEALGYRPIFRYEKFRTEFQVAGQPGVATLDETPIGFFLELEGPAEWIDEAAGRLGFSEESYITDSYGTLYLKFCAANGVCPTHMVFRSH